MNKSSFHTSGRKLSVSVELRTPNNPDVITPVDISSPRCEPFWKWHQQNTLQDRRNHRYEKLIIPGVIQSELSCKKILPPARTGHTWGKYHIPGVKHADPLPMSPIKSAPQKHRCNYFHTPWCEAHAGSTLSIIEMSTLKLNNMSIPTKPPCFWKPSFGNISHRAVIT